MMARGWWRSIAAALVAAAAPGPARAGQAGRPEGAYYTLTLAKAVADDKALRLHLDCRDGHVAAAFATAPAFNKAAHDVDASGLTLQPGRLRGGVKVTINPDPWVPRDGRPVACAFALDAAVDRGSVTGTYKGSYGGQAKEGTVTGTAARPDPAAPARFRLGLRQALRRLAPRKGVSGPNTDYALDMTLTFAMEGGQAVRPRFETIVPDYRGYSAIVDRLDVRLDGSALAATAAITVDYGQEPQARYGPDAKRVEQYTYRLKGLAIGDAVAGTFNAEVGRLHDRGCRFVGLIDRAPPPRAEASLGFLRLHGAMRNRWPVLLYLSLSDGERVHGYAYTPRYNHQPQAVDASGLRREGDRLKGRVMVSVAPDCYKPPEEFDVRLAIDARIEAGVIDGRFTATDAGEKFSGPITGDLRPKAPPAVTARTLRTCRLDLGYCLPSGPMPKKDWRGPKPNYASVRLHLAGGRVRRAEIFNPHDARAFSAAAERADLRIDADRLIGSIAFTITDAPVVSKGSYRYTFQAVIDGADLTGFWRGSFDGRPILTKSAKLAGTLLGIGPSSRRPRPAEPRRSPSAQ